MGTARAVDVAISRPGASGLRSRASPGQESVWDYPRPTRREPDVREVIVRIGGHEIAPSLVACTVDSIPVVAQPWRFYGGWVTPARVGPFEGELGSGAW